MRFEKAMKMMLRNGRAVRRQAWLVDKCMFVDVRAGYHATYTVHVENWDNDYCSIAAEDMLAEDWECCPCPEEHRYPIDIKPATVS